jgi:hypothetical protein
VLAMAARLRPGVRPSRPLCPMKWSTKWGQAHQVGMAGFEPVASCSQISSSLSQDVAASSLMCHLTAAMLAGRRLMALEVCACWLPLWLPQRASRAARSYRFGVYPADLSSVFQRKQRPGISGLHHARHRRISSHFPILAYYEASRPIRRFVRIRRHLMQVHRARWLNRQAVESARFPGRTKRGHRTESGQKRADRRAGLDL